MSASSASICTTSGSSTSATACLAGIGPGYRLHFACLPTLIKWFLDRLWHGQRVWRSWASAAPPSSPRHCQRLADAAVLHAHPYRRRRDISTHWALHTSLHDGRRGDRPLAATRLGTGRLFAALTGSTRTMITNRHVVRLSGAEDATVLADLAGALPRTSPPASARIGQASAMSQGDVLGKVISYRLPRASSDLCEPVQHGWPLLLGVRVGISSAAE